MQLRPDIRKSVWSEFVGGNPGFSSGTPSVLGCDDSESCFSPGIVRWVLAGQTLETSRHALLSFRFSIEAPLRINKSLLSTFRTSSRED